VKQIRLSALDVLGGLSLIAMLAIHPVGAQEAKTPEPQASQPAPLPLPTTFHLEVDQADLAAISNALMELPKKVADPIISKLNIQLQKQMQVTAPAPKPAEEKR
jgi:hypothetical protein